MRTRITKGGLTVNAIAGTHVVILGFDLPKSRANGLLGFAIQREDHTENERYWMSGLKTFAATDPLAGPGGQVSSREHPFQTFQWSDYSAKPDHDYTYRVIALRGKPAKLKESETVTLRIQTETESSGTHTAFFNRGAAASQEYARRFQNEPPSKAGPAAYKWLSRGLQEAMLAFIAQANGAKFSLYGAIYEFQWPEVLAAIRAAAKTGAKVRIVYDAAGAKKANEAAIAAAKIKALCRPRAHTTAIAHNKFFVLTKTQGDKEVPVSVWTGSTNLTENGIFGHSNLAHIVRDAKIAQAYLNYWRALSGDPTGDTIKAWDLANSPAPTPPLTAITPVFSPRKGLAPLDWYAALAGSASRGLFMTFAFGMHEKFSNVYGRNDGVLRFALMETKGMTAAAKATIDRIRRLPNCVVAVGNAIKTNSFDHWLAELPQIVANVHVRYIHTKYMLVDPLGKAPVVVTGSANFSKASTDANDENMLVIRRDARVADIYLGEFMRLHSHYAFREAVAIAKAKHETWSPKNLAPDDTWTKDYYKPKSPRALRRQYFAGT